MFEGIKEKAMNRVIDELVCFTIAGYNIFKSQPVSEELLIEQCTQNGKITKEQILSSLKRLTEDESISFKNGWNIRSRTDTVEEAFKQLKHHVKQPKSNEVGKK